MEVRQSGMITSYENKTFKKEIMLLKTLAITVIVFVICWSGFTANLITDPVGINHHAKKVSIVVINKKVNAECSVVYKQYV